MSKGISKEVILKESEKMIKARGTDNFSLRALSAHLGIKPASLYNHVSGIDEIYAALAAKTAEKMKLKLAAAVEGKPADEAFIAGAVAYKEFAERNHNMYSLLIKARSFKDEQASRLVFYAFSPLKDVILTYGLSRENFMIFIRSLRSFMHGFIEITRSGFMQRASVSREETYLTALDEMLKILKAGGRSC